LNSLGFEADKPSNNSNDTTTAKLLRIFISLAIFLQYMAQAFSANSPAFSGIDPALIAVKPYQPALICGLKTFHDDPFKVEFIFDQGDSEYTPAQKQAESQKAIDYFLAALTMPGSKMWVNLSPYEQERIIPDNLSVTEMGKTMLEVDYELKQFSAALSDPRTKLGRLFWDKVYQKIGKRYGTTQIPIGTFNKVWIVPAQAEVQENDDTAFVTSDSLEVLLDEDYLALNQQKSGDSTSANAEFTQVMREVILPVLQEEVNKGEHFAALRQMYRAFILAVWFKRQMHEQSWAKSYADQEKVTGIDVVNAKVKEKVYQKYLQACNEGAYNYVQKDRVANAHKIITRHYFSGGLSWEKLRLVTRRTALSLSVPGKGWMSGTTFVPMPSLSTATQAKVINKAPRILLVYPRTVSQKYKPTRVPTGLFYLDAAVKDRAFLAKYYRRAQDKRFIYEQETDYPQAQVKIIDLQAVPEDFDFAAAVREFAPDIVGFGTITATINAAKRLAKVVKGNSKALTVVGGFHVSAKPVETMKDGPDKPCFFDIGVFGQGVETFCDIMMYAATGNSNFGAIPGVVVKNGKLSETQRRNPIMALDELPLAPNALKDLQNFPQGYAHQVSPTGVELGAMGTLVTSFGCPNACDFCGSGVVSAHGKANLKVRSAESIFAEIKAWYGQGVTSLYGLDDVFMPDKEQLFKLAVLIKDYKRGNPKFKVNLAVFMRADMVDAEVVQALADIDCGTVAIGVEGGSDEHLQAVGKNLKREHIVNTTKLLKKAGILARWFTMVGLSDWHSVKSLAEFILEEMPDGVRVAQFIPLPGSASARDKNIVLLPWVTEEDFIYEPEQQGKEIDTIPAIVNTPYMTASEMERARRLLLDIFANRHDAEKLAAAMAQIDQETVKHEAAEMAKDKNGGIEFDAQAVNLTVHSTSVNSRQRGKNAMDNLAGVTASIDYIKPWGIK